MLVRLRFIRRYPVGGDGECRMDKGHDMLAFLRKV